jgi:hypothetical protein
MSSIFHTCNKELSVCGLARTWVVVGFLIFSLSGCDNERQKAWRKWSVEVDKFNYRCGTIGDYELRISKRYLFHWPVYEGRSDWESKDPPPLSCTAKLDMMPIEIYWPRMEPAGKRPLLDVISESKDPSYISVMVTAASGMAPWDLDGFFESKLEPGDDKSVFGDYIKTPSGLFRIEKPYRKFSLSSQTYYWESGPNNTAKTLIDCTLSDNGLVNTCRQVQYLSWLGAILELRYQRPQLENWKTIARDVDGFLKRNSTYKRI